MSSKSRDEHNRWRNITVGFRVSPEESEQLNEAVALSGLPKQEYCYRRCMQRDIVVQPNPRVYKALKTTLEKILLELQRLNDAGSVTNEINVVRTFARNRKSTITTKIPPSKSDFFTLPMELSIKRL